MQTKAILAAACGSAVFCLMSLPACGEPDRSVAGPISDSTLVEILAEFQLARSRTVVGYSVSETFEDSVLTAKGITAEEYHRQMDYFLAHPEEFLIIQDAVVKKLEEQDAHLRAPQTEAY